MIPETHKRTLEPQTEVMEVVLTYQQFLDYCDHIERMEERKESLSNIFLISAAATIIPILGFVGYQSWWWVFVFSALFCCFCFGVWSARR